MNGDELIGRRLALWFHTDDEADSDQCAVLVGTVQRDKQGLLMRCRTGTVIALRPDWFRGARPVPWPLRPVLLDADYGILFAVRELPPEADMRWLNFRRRGAPPSVN